MYRYILLFLFNMCLLLSHTNAQKENNNWTFGYHNGLDFSSGTPVFFESKNISVEGSSSISDASGQLLFYSNGNDVWDAAGTVMPNGSGILGNGPSWQAAGSAAQGVAIVKSLEDFNQYYLFVLDAYEDLSPNYPGYLRYSVIDMSLNGGLGDVVSTQKNIVLDSFMAEQMVLAKGVGCSYWLIAHKHNEAKFQTFKIDATGIHPPVSSVTGFTPPTSPWGGEMAISSDATKIAKHTTDTAFRGVIELSSFDTATGVVSNTVVFDVNNDNIRTGMSFSPDNSKLYISYFLTLYQFDLSKLPNIADVDNSKYAVAKVNSPQYFSCMRLGPDGKLYLAMPKTEYIGRIDRPNEAGAACAYDSVALKQPASALFPVMSGPLWGFGLGANVLPPPPADTLITVIDTLYCMNEGATLMVDTGYSNYIWDDSTTGNERTIMASGTYWVTYQESSCYYFTDTFKVEALELDPVINVDEFDLSTTLTYSSYQWFLNGDIIPGATEKTYTVSENGFYTVVVTNEQGCIDTSDAYEVTNVTGINNIDFLSSSINIYPNPAHNIVYIKAPIQVDVTVSSIEGRIVLQRDNVQDINIDSWAEGIYLMRITDRNKNLIKVEKFVKVK